MIDRKETERYLGYMKVRPDAQIDARIDACIAQIEKTMDCRSVKRYEPMTIEDETIRIADMEIHSQSLLRNLKDCTSVCLFAATIGPEIDRLIRRAEIVSMTDAAIYQAAGAAAIESYVDQVNQTIIAEADGYCRPRFSCGYGDFDLHHQRDFARLLNLPKTIGVTLTDTLLMQPSKSVTALVGISPKPSHCILQGCEACSRTDCTYRR
ncbi:vitamin B12 dependent-methionine synthase activation domain-containing protein [Catenisphaera adipataccumulans]|uniref:AdoMet activation domain-containing protein n=1 Tax=Catenisphaera adipataccumulans TaxID=700500 RepID=A0A7W8CWR1_9FIRM|nr:vitamin B12 dependent-methionine synthase activation domain-containing protein [Catenisphaera adipataccumulans]MBB5183012.1 hypothetical protein [Catenisphaera adipataccumulans]